ncbi:MAG TPA: 16S rRNA (cytidine(1402)-2'-O)-methyltransferase [Candidatus Acidoferrum sp.]|nr:16S rRNA (cytidine(1402)-2'-O)-methyltransferase [Candidatus Acidoferrum sp.]
MQGTLYIVATPIGNVADITQRAVEVLTGVAVIAVEDTRHSGKLLHALGIATPMLSCHEYNEEQRSEQLLKRIAAGEDVALISDAGTPLVSDPGYQLVKLAHQRGCKVVPIPGASAVITALCCAGLPTDRFVFEGFLPAKTAARQARLQEVQQEIRSLVFYEAPHRIEECLQDMVDAFGADREATLLRELTKTFETIVPASLGKLLELVKADENQRKGEIVLVVAGADKASTQTEADAEKVLKILLSELPVRQASALAAKITGVKKNRLYDLALSWQEIKD